MELPNLGIPATWYLLLAGGVAVVLALAALLVTLTALLAPDRRLRRPHWHAHRSPTEPLSRAQLPDDFRVRHAPER